MSESKQMPLSERIGCVRKQDGLQPAQLLENVTVEQFFEGVAMLTGRAYPLWLGKHIATVYHLSPGHLYSYLVRQAYALLEDGAFEADGVELLYRLLVEPFLFIRQCDGAFETKNNTIRKEDSNHV